MSIGRYDIYRWNVCVRACGESISSVMRSTACGSAAGACASAARARKPPRRALSRRRPTARPAVRVDTLSVCTHGVGGVAAAVLDGVAAAAANGRGQTRHRFEMVSMSTPAEGAAKLHARLPASGHTTTSISVADAAQTHKARSKQRHILQCTLAHSWRNATQAVLQFRFATSWGGGRGGGWVGAQSNTASSPAAAAQSLQLQLNAAM